MPQPLVWRGEVMQDARGDDRVEAALGDLEPVERHQVHFLEPDVRETELACLLRGVPERDAVDVDCGELHVGLRGGGAEGAVAVPAAGLEAVQRPACRPAQLAVAQKQTDVRAGPHLRLGDSRIGELLVHRTNRLGGGVHG
jgi:hypothetical protein